MHAPLVEHLVNVSCLALEKKHVLVAALFRRDDQFNQFIQSDLEVIQIRDQPFFAHDRPRTGVM